MEKIKALIKKFCTKEVIFYAIFGVLTTIVNMGAYYILATQCKIEANASNVIAIILAVLFAYFTNRKLVFNSKATTFSENLIEFIKFLLGRAFTMVVEFLGFFFLNNVLQFTLFNGLVSKAIVTVIVIILNFFVSKFFAFKK